MWKVGNCHSEVFVGIVIPQDGKIEIRAYITSCPYQSVKSTKAIKYAPEV